MFKYKHFKVETVYCNSISIKRMLLVVEVRITAMEEEVKGAQYLSVTFYIDVLWIAKLIGLRILARRIA